MSSLQELRSDVMIGKWSEVFEMYKKEKTLGTAKITGTGDTVLHMAVLSGEENVVATMVDLLVHEEKDRAQNNVVVTVDGDDDGGQRWNLNSILGAENNRKNTPLHIVATIRNIEMCKIIGKGNPSLIVRCDLAGETPLFVAA